MVVDNLNSFCTSYGRFTFYDRDLLKVKPKDEGAHLWITFHITFLTQMYHDRNRQQKNNSIGNKCCFYVYEKDCQS